MAKQRLAMVLDTETATYSWVKDFIKDYAARFAISVKRKLAQLKQMFGLAKPIIYDIGWVLMNKSGKIVETYSCLVNETFFNDDVFSTAYYADKRDLYLEKLKNGEIQCKSWLEIIQDLVEAMKRVEFLSAYNAAFDFFKALPTTIKYMTEWVFGTAKQKLEFKRKQEWHIENHVFSKGGSSEPKMKKKPEFTLCGVTRPVVCLWGLACERIINIPKYMKYCMESGRISASAMYFSTSAESCFGYLEKNYGYVEEHTALADALIEASILYKCWKKGEINPSIEAFPFRKLGTTFAFVDSKPANEKYRPIVEAKIEEYMDSKNPNWRDEGAQNPYQAQLLRWYQMPIESL